MQLVAEYEKIDFSDLLPREQGLVPFISSDHSLELGSTDIVWETEIAASLLKAFLSGLPNHHQEEEQAGVAQVPFLKPSRSQLLQQPRSHPDARPGTASEEAPACR